MTVTRTAPRSPRLPSNAEKFAAFENEVFDTATMFTAVTMRLRAGRERIIFATPTDAFDYARGRDRTVVYAANALGRTIVLDRALWPSWLARYTERENQR